MPMEGGGLSSCIHKPDPDLVTALGPDCRAGRARCDPQLPEAVRGCLGGCLGPSSTREDDRRATSGNPGEQSAPGHGPGKHLIGHQNDLIFVSA